MPTHGQTTLGHGRSQSQATVGLVAGCKGRFEVNTLGAHHRVDQTLLARCLVGVIAGAADLQDTARLDNSYLGAGLQQAYSPSEFPGKEG